MLAIFRSTAHVVDRLCQLRRKGSGSGNRLVVQRFPHQRCARLYGKERGRRDGSQSNAGSRAGLTVQGYRGSYAHHRDVHLVAGNEAEVTVGRMRLGRRDAEFDKEFIWLQHRAPWGYHKVFDCHRACSL